MNDPMLRYDPLCIGPSSFARYLAGEPPTDAHGLTQDAIHNIQLAVYEDDVGSVRREHQSHLSDHNTRINAAQRFRRRLHLAQTDRQLEDAGYPEYETNTFILTESGDIYYPRDNVTLESLHVRQRDITPGYYSLADHQLSLLVMKAFRSGATRVVAYYGEGRDLIEMTYDHASNIGKTRIINTEKIDGKLHSTEEMKEIVRQRFLGQNEVAPSPAIFMMSDVKLEQAQIQRAVSDISPTTDTFRKSDLESDRMNIHHESRPDAERYHSDRTLTDEKIKRASVIFDTVSRPLETTGATLWRSGKNALKDVSVSAVAVSGFLYARHRENAAYKGHTITEKRNKLSILEKVHTLFQKKTVEDGDRNRYEKLMEAVTARLFMPVAQGGLAFAVLAIALKEVPKWDGRSEKKISADTNPGEKKARRSRKIIFREHSRAGMEKRQKGRKKRNILYKNGERVTQTRRLKDRHGSVRKKKEKSFIFAREKEKKTQKGNGVIERERQLRKEVRKKRMIEKKLLKALKRLSRFFVKQKLSSMDRSKIVSTSFGEARNKNERKSTLVNPEKKNIQIPLKEASARFAFACVLWVLFEFTHIQKHREKSAGKRNHRSETAKSQHELNESVNKNEGIQWILLSIIYYLTAIRESCVAGSNTPKQGKKHTARKKMKGKKRLSTHFPSQGVLFTFAPIVSTS